MESWDEYGEVHEDYWQPSSEDIERLVARFPNVGPVRDLLVAGTPGDLEQLAEDIHNRLAKGASKPKAGARAEPEPDHDAVVTEFLEDNAKVEVPRHVNRHTTEDFLNSLFSSQRAAAEAAESVAEVEDPGTVEDAIKSKDFQRYFVAKLAEANNN